MKSRRFLSLFCALTLLFSLVSPALAAADPGDLNEEDNFVWTVNEDGASVTLTGINHIMGSELAIPATLGGKPVTALGCRILSTGGYYMSSLTIPASVVEIDPIFIGSYSTMAEPGLTHVYVEAGNPAYKDVDGVLYNADGTELLYYPCYRQDSTFAVPEGVTAIGEYAFYWNRVLAGVTLPSSLKTIKPHAFDSASKLSSVSLPEGLVTLGDNAFASTALTELSIPASVTSIGKGLLFQCSKITGITLACPVVPEGFLWNCSGLKTLTLSEGVETISADAFHGCTGLTAVNIPANVTTIGNSAFNGCWNLTSVTFAPGSKLTDVGEHAFYYCSDLESLVLPDSVTTLGKAAMGHCGLKDIHIPPKVTHLPDQLFSRCGKLKDVVVPDTVKTMGDQVFFQCVTYADTSNTTAVSGLESVVLPEDLTAVPDSTFSGCDFLRSVDIPAGVTSIGDSAFRSCTRLGEIALPEGLTEIGTFAFSGCRGLKAVDIPDGVKVLPRDAFSWCPSLQEVALPATLATVGFSAFEQCTHLEALDFPATLKTLDSNAFAYCPALRQFIFRGDAPTSTSVTNPNSALRNPLGSAELPKDRVVEVYRPAGAKGFEVGGIWDTAYVDLKDLDDGEPAGPTLVNTAITLSAALERSPQKKLMLWLTVDVTPKSHPDAPTLTPAGAITAVIDGKGMAQPTHFVGGGTNTHQTFGYDITGMEGQEISVRVELAPSMGFNGSRSATATGTVVMPNENESLPLVPGGVVNPEGEYTYESDAAGAGVVITGIMGATANMADIKLPDTLGGKSVTGLGENLFSGLVNAAYITVPQTVTSFGAGAFQNCPNLVSVSIPNGIAHLPDNLFANSPKFYLQNLPEGITSIGKNAFAGCDKNLSFIEFPASLTAIGENAFQGSSLAHAYFPGDAPTCDGNPFPAGLVVHRDKNASGYGVAPWTGLAQETGEPISLVITGLHPEITRLASTKEYTLFLQNIVTEPKNYFGGAKPDFSKLTITLDGEPVSDFEVSDANVVFFHLDDSLVGETVPVTLAYQGDTQFQPSSQPYTQNVVLTDPMGKLTVTVTPSAVEQSGSAYVLPLAIAFSTEKPVHNQAPYLPLPGDLTYTLGDRTVAATPAGAGRVTIPVAADQLGQTLTLTVVTPDQGYFRPTTVTLPVTVTEPVTPPAPPSGGGSSGTSNAKPSAGENAKVTVSSKDAAEAVKAAADSGSVVLKAETKEDAKSVAVTVPASVMKAIAKAEAPVSIQSSVADLTLDAKVLEALQQNGVKDVVVSAGAADTAALPKAAQTALEGRPVYDISITVGGKTVSQFGGGSVTAALPYTLAAGESADKLTVCRVKGDGTTEVLRSSAYKNGKLTFSTPHLSTYAILHAEVDFLDVSEDNWFKNDIDFTVARGILNGMGDDGDGGELFGPAVTLTGTMAVVALARMDGVADGTGEGWAAPAIAWAEEKDILPEDFHADSPLTREQFAYLVAGYLGGAKASNAPDYLDRTQITSSCLDSIYYLASIGVMNGTGDGYFSPKLTLTRSELAAVLHRLVVLQLG